MSELKDEDIHSFAFQISAIDEILGLVKLDTMDEIERRIESDPEPRIFKFYINFQFSKAGPYIVVAWWFCAILLGVFYGFDVLNLTVFEFSAPSGTDGFTADSKMKSQFKSISDSRQLLIYYTCDSCGDSLPIEWTPNPHYTPYKTQEYYGWTLNDMGHHLQVWAQSYGHNIFESYHDFYGTYFSFGLNKLGQPQNQILSQLAPQIFISKTNNSAIGILSYDNTKDQTTKNNFIDDLHDECARITNKYGNGTISMGMTGESALIKAMNEESRKDVEKKDTLTIPIALCVLALIIRSWRLMFIPLLTFGTSICCSFSVMRPFAEHVLDVNPFCPSIMMSVTIAMSIDYSLFLLSRYREEVERNSHHIDKNNKQRMIEISREAIRQTTRWSGKVIALSGCILSLTYFGLIFYPMQVLQSVGLGAGLAIICTIIVNLTLTPALLLIFPYFFSQFGWAGCPFQRFCCGCNDEVNANKQSLCWKSASEPLLVNAQNGVQDLVIHNVADTDSDSDEEGDLYAAVNKNDPCEKCWYHCGSKSTICPWSILISVVVYAAIAPIGWQFTSFKQQLADTLIFPRDSSYYSTYKSVVTDFSAGFIAPWYILIFKKESQEPISSVKYSAYINETGYLIQDVWKEVSTSTHNGGYELTIEGIGFLGSNSINGIAEGSVITEALWLNNITCESMKCQQVDEAYQYLVDNKISDDNSSSYYQMTTVFDPYYEHAIDFVSDFRGWLSSACDKYGYDCYITGGSIDEVDSVKKMYSSFPIVLGCIVGFVFCLMGIVFKSVFVPFGSGNILVVACWFCAISVCVFYGVSYHNYTAHETDEYYGHITFESYYDFYDTFFSYGLNPNGTAQNQIFLSTTNNCDGDECVHITDKCGNGTISVGMTLIKAMNEKKDTLTIIIRSWRLMFIPLFAFGTSICWSFSVLRPFGEYVSVMMPATIAMSIDYSLFLLSRFRDEVEPNNNKQRMIEISREAIRQTTRWSGKVIALSGCILSLTYFGLIFYPMQVLQSVGLGAGLAIICTIIVNLTLLLLIFPYFFSPFCCASDDDENVTEPLVVNSQNGVQDLVIHNVADTDSDSDEESDLYAAVNENDPCEKCWYDGGGKWSICLWSILISVIVYSTYKSVMNGFIAPDMNETERRILSNNLYPYQVSGQEMYLDNVDNFDTDSWQTRNIDEEEDDAGILLSNFEIIDNLVLFCFVVATFLLFSKNLLVLFLVLQLVKGAYCYNISCVGYSICFNETMVCLDDEECNIWCLYGESACYGATINGGNSAALNILCDGGCFEATINGGNASALNVRCNGYGSCYDTIINGEETRGLTIAGGGDEGNMYGVNINCPNNAICNITCSMFRGCMAAQINASLSSILYIYAFANDYQVMANSTIYCPNDGLYGNTNNCNLFMDEGVNSLQTWLSSEIYAIEGLNDINIYCSDNCIPESGYQPIIYCTEDFSANCSVSTVDINNQTESEWECSDPDSICSTYFIPTSHPTKAPTAPTQYPTNPTDSPSNAPSTSPIITPYSSSNVLYVRQKGCDVGDCSSSKEQFDYDLICQNQHIYETDKCCNDMPQPQNSTYSHSTPTIPTECQSHNITTINNNTIFNNSFVAYQPYNVYVQHIESVCVTMQNTVCYHPVITVQFEAIDYYHYGRFYVAYKNPSNMLNGVGCLDISVGENCDKFLDCPITRKYAGDGAWFPSDGEEYKIFYFINSEEVEPRCSPLRDMSVRLQVDCTDYLKPSTCKTLSYAWNCFNGHYDVCGHYDSNGIIDLGDGVFELDDVIRSMSDQVIIRGTGIENTFLNHSLTQNITKAVECSWQCFITIKDLTLITSNTSFEIFNRAHVRFSNVRFDGAHSSAMFNFDGIGTNVTFIDCIFVNYHQVYNLFIISNQAMISVTNTVFTDNTLAQDMIVVNGGIVVFDTVHFVNNKGTGNAIISLINSKDDYSSIDIQNSLFYQNQNLLSLIYQNGFNGAISVSYSIFGKNINMKHLIAMQDVNSTITILQTHFADNNDCLETYCLQLLDANVNIDLYSANIWTAYPTSSPTAIPTTAMPTTAPTIPSVECGTDIVSGSTTGRYAINLYSLILDVFASKVEINSCGSLLDTYIYFYHSDMTVIYECDDCGDCDVQTILSVFDVNAGFYVIGIGGFSSDYGSYIFSVTCDYPLTTNHTQSINVTAAPTKLPTTTQTMFYTTTNPTVNPTVNPTHPTTAPSQQTPAASYGFGFTFIGFGHSQNNTKYNTLTLTNFKPEILFQHIDLIRFGAENGTIIYEPCKPFNNSDFNNSIIFHKISTNMKHDHNYKINKFQQILNCNGTVNCYMECRGACVGSQIISNATNSTLISCSSTFSCLQTMIDIKHSKSAYILCKAESSCKQSVITAKYMRVFIVECLDRYSCLETTIDIKNASQMEVRCYSPNACDSIHIYSDSDNITFKFYNYNKDVSIYVPTLFIVDNLDCNPLDAYLRLDGTEFISLEQFAMDLFGGSLPCDGITYSFTETEKVECEVRYSFINYLSILDYLYDIISCFFPIWISEFTAYDCYGTLPPTHDPTTNPTIDPTTNIPTKSPTNKPTRDPTLSNGYDSYFEITYLMENCTDRVLKLITENAPNVFANITLFIEGAYAEETGLQYNNFWVLIQNVDGIQIEEIGDDKSDGTLLRWRMKRKIFIHAKVYCNEDFCNYLATYNQHEFESNTQAKIRKYFNETVLMNANADIEDGGNGITFSIYKADGIEVKELNPTIPNPWFDPVIIGLLSFIAIMIIISIFSLLHKIQKLPCCTKTIIDDTMWFVPMLFALQIWDFVSDINLSIEMVSNYGFGVKKGKEIFFVCTLGSIFFIIVPYALNLVMACTIKRLVSRNETAASYYDYRIAIFVTIVCLSGSTFTALQFTSSAIFGLNIINSGLTDYEINELSKLKVFGTIFCENVPQLLIQLIYSVALNSISPNVVLSFTASSISIISAMLSYIIQQRDGSDKRRVYRYNLRFNKQNGIVTADETQLLLKNKGRTETMSKMIAEIFQTPHKNIQISKQCIPTQYGLVFYVVHCLNETELRDDENDYVIAAKVYVEEVYKQYANEFNVRFRDHFGLRNINYTISINKSLTVSMTKTKSILLKNIKSAIDLHTTPTAQIELQSVGTSNGDKLAFGEEKNDALEIKANQDTTTQSAESYDDGSKPDMFDVLSNSDSEVPLLYC